MKPLKIDPRIVRTRAALRDALARLLREQDFEALTLNEIAVASGLNRATIYKHHADKFALLDAWIGDEFRDRLVAATHEGEWTGPKKLGAVIATACQCMHWVGSLGRSEDRLLRPIAAARIRALLLRTIEYALAHKLVVAPSGKPELAAAMASAAIYGAAEAWTPTAASGQRALDAYVARVIAGLAGIIAPATTPPPWPRPPLTFD